MTCIAAIKADGKVWMAGDHLGSNGFSKELRTDPKVFILDDFLIGFTSSFRMGQLLRYQFTPPKNEETDNMKYMVCHFVEAVRELFCKYGYSSIDNNKHRGGLFLVGYKGEIYRIDSDFQVGTSYRPFTAIGSGEDLALGSLYTTDTTEFRDKISNRLITALMAAETYDGSVGCTKIEVLSL
jgi:20S proteasome alpha/beta subunit